MNKDLRRFAFIGLVISLLAALSFIAFLLVRGLSAVDVLTVDADIVKKGLLFSGLSIILGLAVTAILDPENTRRFLVGRHAQYGSNALIAFLAFVGVLIFVNVMTYQYSKTWDLTEDKSNTLAPETIQILQSLPQPVTARAYFTARISSDEARKLLDLFAQNSQQKFGYEFIDPESNPLAAQADGIERDGTIVLIMGEQKEPVVYADEQELDIALLRLVNPEARPVYFLTGHGELPIDQPSDTDALMQAANSLRKKNYSVNTLNLQSTGKVPEEARVLIVAGPQVPLTEAEAQALETWLDGGGSLIVMYEPLLLTRFGDTPDPLAAVLAKWGITFDNDLVIDPNVTLPFFAVSDISAYARHPITEKLRGYNTVFLTARSLRLDEGAGSGLILTPLVQTYDDAWGETDFDSINQNQDQFDEGQDNPGPLVLAAAATKLEADGRLVVFGDSEFAADTLYSRGNGDIFINAVDWAAQQEDLISLTPKPTMSRLFKTPSTLGTIGILLTSLCLIPLLVLGGGAWAWYARRQRG